MPILLFLLIAPCFAQAQSLSEQRSQAQQVALSNGAADPANVAMQLAEAFGSRQNEAALVAKAKTLAEANPAEAAAIAAAAAVFSPSSAVLIARTIAAVPSANAALVAAAVAAVVPESAAAIAAAVAAAVPASAAAVAAAVGSIAPGGADYKGVVSDDKSIDHKSTVDDPADPGSEGVRTTPVRLPWGLQTMLLNPSIFSGAPTPTPASPSN